MPLHLYGDVEALPAQSSLLVKLFVLFSLPDIVVELTECADELWVRVREAGIREILDNFLPSHLVPFPQDLVEKMDHGHNRLPIYRRDFFVPQPPPVFLILLALLVNHLAVLLRVQEAHQVRPGLFYCFLEVVV